jgi:hypothetical protein
VNTAFEAVFERNQYSREWQAANANPETATQTSIGSQGMGLSIHRPITWVVGILTLV